MGQHHLTEDRPFGKDWRKSDLKAEPVAVEPSEFELAKEEMRHEASGSHGMAIRYMLIGPKARVDGFVENSDEFKTKWRRVKNRRRRGLP